MYICIYMYIYVNRNVMIELDIALWSFKTVYFVPPSTCFPLLYFVFLRWYTCSTSSTFSFHDQYTCPCTGSTTASCLTRTVAFLGFCITSVHCNTKVHISTHVSHSKGRHTLRVIPECRCSLLGFNFNIKFHTEASWDTCPELFPDSTQMHQRRRLWKELGLFWKMKMRLAVLLIFSI